MDLISVPCRLGKHVCKNRVALRCKETIEIGVLGIRVVRNIADHPPSPAVVGGNGGRQWSPLAEVVMHRVIIVFISGFSSFAQVSYSYVSFVFALCFSNNRRQTTVRCQPRRIWLHEVPERETF